MRNIIIPLIIGLIIGFGGPAAAEQDAQQDVHTQQMALMQERDNLLLETVQLLKSVAKDKDAKAKAESLERRVKANIEKHGKMHAMMQGHAGMGGMSGMGGMAGMGGHNPGCCGSGAGCCGGKDTPCPKKEAAPPDTKAN